MLWSTILACGPQLTAPAAPEAFEEELAPPTSLVGTTPDDGELHLADLARTEGVDAGLAISTDGLWALAGMKGFTCDIWTRDGSLHADTDYPGGGDRVIDDDNDRLLVRTNDGLFVTRFGHSSATGVVAEEFLADGRLVGDGIVTLAWESQSCRAAWYTRTDAADARTGLEEFWCGAGVAIVSEPATGALWLLTNQELVRATPEGLDHYEIGGDLLAWDPVWQQLYVATSGTHLLRVVDWNGSYQTWTTEVPITALGTLGDVGAVVVGGADRLEVLWGEDGTLWGSYEGLLRPQGQMFASQSGAVLAWQDATAGRFVSGEVY